MAKPITFANSQPDLPGSDFAQSLQHLRLKRLFAANGNEQAAKPHPEPDRSMVAKEQPYPSPRPPASVGAEVDTAAFNARWQAEHRRVAKPHQKSQPEHGDRNMSDTPKQPNRPVETLREGSLKAAIWRNESENGSYHSVTVARSYRDKEGNLHDTNSLRAKDMLGLSELARRAHHQTHDLDREAFKESRRAQPAQAKTRDTSKGR